LAKLKSSSVIKLIQSLTNLFKLIFEYTCTQFIKLLFSLWNQTTLPSLIDTKDIKYLMMSHFVLPMSESSVPQTEIDDESVQKVIHLANLLECCQFTAFWV